MRTFLLSAAIALVGLGIVDEAQAQRGRGGRGFGGGWGGWGGSGWGGWGGTGYGNYGYNRGFGYGNYGYGNSYGGYGYRGNGYGNPWFSYFRFPGYTSGYSGYSYNSYPGYSTYNYLSPNYYYQNGTSASESGPRQLASDESVILVRVPEANAKVLFDGQATSQTGTERIFFPPKLESGSTYHYTVTASFDRNGNQVQEQRDVKVVPGQPSFVDFTTSQPAETVNPPK